MRRMILAAVFILGLGFLHAAPALALDPGLVGLVVLHGKLGSPKGLVSDLTAGLKASGFLVVAPEMPWSSARRFDKDYVSSLLEIDDAVRGLRTRGAVKVVLVGHSLGANAALGYAAGPAGADALVCIAAGHQPERDRNRQRFASDVAKAKEMVAAGRGQEVARFADVNTGVTLLLEVPAFIYLSYNDPEGSSVMPKNAAAIRAPLPLLWIVGSADPITRGPEYAFDLVPKHPLSRYEVVVSDHKGAPSAAVGLVVRWLHGLWP